MSDSKMDVKLAFGEFTFRERIKVIVAIIFGYTVEIKGLKTTIEMISRSPQ